MPCEKGLYKNFGNYLLRAKFQKIYSQMIQEYSWSSGKEEPKSLKRKSFSSKADIEICQQSSKSQFAL